MANSFIKKYAISLLERVIDDLKNDKCSDDEIVDSLSKFNPENNGFIKEEEYWNTDKCMNYLKLSYNRNKFFKLTKKYHIENKRVNNMPIGFKKSEIEELYKKLYL